jgi:hypothetical protein
MISADQALRYIMGILASIFFCIVVTPVLIVIGFAGKSGRGGILWPRF